MLGATMLWARGCLGYARGNIPGYRLITTYSTYDEPTSRLEEPFMRLVKRSKCAMSMSSTMSSRHAERQASTGSLPPGLAPEISGAPCCTRGRSRCCMLGSV